MKDNVGKVYTLVVPLLQFIERVLSLQRFSVSIILPRRNKLDLSKGTPPCLPDSDLPTGPYFVRRFSLFNSSVRTFDNGRFDTRSSGSHVTPLTPNSIVLVLFTTNNSWMIYGV